MNDKMKKALPYLFMGIVSSATTLGAYKLLDNGTNNNDADYSFFAPKKGTTSFVGMNTAATSDDFVRAAKTTVPAVVTIKNYKKITPNRATNDDIFEYFFGNPFGGGGRREQQQMPDNMPSGMGSGVIISPDGYIISNNHVVAGANKLEVVLSNKKTYIATLVGTDPNTDISLLKIEDKGLPYLNFADSDAVEVGQWVLAVGNPMGLNSTVTAGIISAKGRGIGILGSKGEASNPIESFLQTDAAINPGNSGGALVNANGDLIGINSAISSTNGYYQGYGFAVPSNLARKIVEDIKKFGIVQRGFLGIGVFDLSDEQAVASYNKQEKTNIKVGSGVYVRQGSSSVPASEESIRQMIKETDGDSYEKLRSLNQNLTFNYTEQIFKENNLAFGLSQKKTLGLIGEDDLYTNFALLLSEQCNHTLKVAVFEGIEKNIFKDRKEFKGSLLKQVTEAFEFINLVNKTEATFEGLIRKDERDYPVEAIREALLNAVIHREYSFSGSTLVNIYEDRIEFVSLGGIVYGLSLDSIMLGVSQSRNEKLANIFYRLHLIEAYGTGIRKIFTNYERYNMKPTIKAEVGAFQVVLPNIHYKKIEEKLLVDSLIKPLYTDILNFVTDKNGATRKEIEEYINFSQTRVITLLKEMLELNLIRKEIR